MKKTVARLAFVAVMAILVMAAPGVSTVAQASQIYDYSYTFTDGKVLSGSFTGVASGNLITNLTNISVTYNNVAFNGNGSLSNFGINNYAWNLGQGVVSFNGLANNFAFLDSTLFNGTHTNFTYFITNSGPSNYDVRAENTNGTYSYSYDDTGYNAANWHVTPAGGSASAVATPEPGTMMLLGSGVLTFGLSRFRRRKQEVVA